MKICEICEICGYIDCTARKILTLMLEYSLSMGKGEKDRTIPLPQAIVPEIMQQMEVIKQLHDNNLEAVYSRVRSNEQETRNFTSYP
ncbi:MAG: hypothetical protein QME42_05390 [bacterium]|nr:hypothetical protein [bacterium]